MEIWVNYVWVGIVMLVLLVIVVVVVIWIVWFFEGMQNEYDIFFKQLVDGFVKGFEVLFVGVLVGQIKEIELWKKDFSFVCVWIVVQEMVLILVGIIVMIQGSFIGVLDIQFEGVVKGVLLIVELGLEGVLVILMCVGGLGVIFNSVLLLFEWLVMLIEWFNVLLGDENQKLICGIFVNSEWMIKNFVDVLLQVKQMLVELQEMFRQVCMMLVSFDKVVGFVDKLLGSDGELLVRQLCVMLVLVLVVVD